MSISRVISRAPATALQASQQALRFGSSSRFAFTPSPRFPALLPLGLRYSSKMADPAPSRRLRKLYYACALSIDATFACLPAYLLLLFSFYAARLTEMVYREPGHFVSKSTLKMHACFARDLGRTPIHLWLGSPASPTAICEPWLG